METIDCQYPLIHQSNQRPYHFIHGFIEHLNSHLQLQMKPTRFAGDIHLSPEEKGWTSQVHEAIGDDRRFWIIVAGGKSDFTNKWWSPARYQKVINAFRGKIQFVQIGATDHWHPALDGVIDLRGRTDLRQLVRLVYHSQGVVCPVTAVMHLAAAVETRPGSPASRPCVVIAGGREPTQWEAYPCHQFIHTLGALPCCATGGCWKSRVKPIGDGDEKDHPENLCVDVVDDLPHCLHLISAEEVIRRIELYFSSGQISYLNQVESPAEQVAVVDDTPRQRYFWEDLNSELNLSESNASALLTQVISRIPDYPGGFAGDGIVVCGGGAKLFPSAWVCLNLLRDQGCKLPIQLWYLGSEEMDEAMISLVSQLGVECVDAREREKIQPMRILSGWELKPFAIVHSPFERVLLLDADNMVLTDAAQFFNWNEFKATGAVFWPDLRKLALDRGIWQVCGVEYQEEWEFESGQILVDKAKCWNALLLSLWFNANSDFYFRYVHGDKETFHMAFRRLGMPYAMPSREVNALDATMCQHDFSGNRIFQHRNLDKWQYDGQNRNVADFWMDDRCRFHLRTLKRLWSGIVAKPQTFRNRLTQILSEHDFRFTEEIGRTSELSFQVNGLIGKGRNKSLSRWRLDDIDGEPLLRLAGEGTEYLLSHQQNGQWVSSGGNTPANLKAILKPRVFQASE